MRNHQMRLLTALAMLICFSEVRAQSDPLDSSRSPASALDAVLQDFAFRAFFRPRTGVPYDGAVPANLSGITIAAMRLRSGSLRARGVKMFKEFEIPKGVIVQPYVERLVLVYQNLGNWSGEYYPPMPGYTFLAPVLGLLTYNASNLSATNLPELDIRASADPILIRFSNVKSTPNGTVAKCVWFDLQGGTNLSNLVSNGKCSTVQQGHFSIVVESDTGPPSAQPPKHGGNASKLWVIIGSLLGGALLLVLVVLLILFGNKYRQKREVERMERAAEIGETLRVTSVGGARAPSARGTRTQPTIETKYVP